MTRPSHGRPGPGVPHDALRSTRRRAGRARRRLRSSPAVDARPSPRNNPRSQRERHARRRQFAARTRHLQGRHDPKRAVARDNDGDAQELAAVGGPRVATGRPEQDEHASGTPCRPRSTSARSAAHLILKRSATGLRAPRPPDRGCLQPGLSGSGPTLRSAWRQGTVALLSASGDGPPECVPVPHRRQGRFASSVRGLGGDRPAPAAAGSITAPASIANTDRCAHIYTLERLDSSPPCSRRQEDLTRAGRAGQW